MTTAFDDLLDYWDTCRTQYQFVRYLRREGWHEIATHWWDAGGTKRVFAKGNVICKFDRFDYAPSPYYFSFAKAWTSMTASEARQYERATGYRKRYIVPTLAYRHGLLVQPRLRNDCNDIPCPHPKARRIASRLRFSHYWHHGTYRGRLYFYDTDTLGSGWYNWKRKRKAKGQS